jgi:hypothetical protein
MYPLLLPEFNETLIFRAYFKKILKYKQKIMKIRTVGTVLYHVGGRPDRHNANLQGPLKIRPS